MRKLSAIALSALCGATLLFAQEAPTGSSTNIESADQALLSALKGTIKGKIVWCSSRANSKHDIWIMNADGTEQKALTIAPNTVDWFPRFSSDGKQVVFTRSKMGWVKESDAEMFDKWDIWTINTDGTGEKKVAENASWGSWRPGDQEILFSRGAKVFIKKLADGAETEIFDADVSIKKGTFAQEPQLSPNGKFLAITLRGTSRETGIFNLEKKVWYKTGGGCEITWLPDNSKVLRMNEGQGNGGTEVLSIPVDADGKPTIKMDGLSIPKEARLMDIPGRRSHEYFPKVSNNGSWLVWGATQVGHEHDLYDYEIYVWKIGTDQKNATRLTFHSGNDRWPDLFVE